MMEVREEIWHSSGASRPSARTPQNRGCSWVQDMLLRGVKGEGEEMGEGMGACLPGRMRGRKVRLRWRFASPGAARACDEVRS